MSRTPSAIMNEQDEAESLRKQIAAKESEIKKTSKSIEALERVLDRLEKKNTSA